jgi:hypothetical protein
MGKFSYWEAGDAPQHDFQRDEALTTEEAQVLATMQLSENMAKVANELSELMYFLRKHSLKVEIDEK